MTGDDHVLARDLAGQAGQRLLELRAQGGDPDVLRKAGDRLSHEFLTAALAGQRPGDVVLSEEGADNPARLGARRVWIVDPLDGTREFGEPGRSDWAVHVALWERTGDGSGEPLLAPGGRPPRAPRAPRRPNSRRRRAPGPGHGPIHARATAGAARRRGARPDPHRGEPEQATQLRSEYFRSY